MPSTKEIRGKIKSVQNTRKITKAMEMVAASKMRKAQDRMHAARPYGDKIRVICSHLARANVTDYSHPFLTSPEGAKKVGIILVSTDKGLAGALNTNIQRMLLQRFRDWSAEGVQVEASALGNKGLGFLQRIGVPVISQAVQLGDRPSLDRLIGAIQVQIEAFKEHKVDNLSADEPQRKFSWDYIYEPDAQTVLDELLRRYVEALIYQAVAENMASEQSARMVAMKAASDNAKKLIDDLQLVYNKTRQAGITKEITEIVGGAAAVS